MNKKQLLEKLNKDWPIKILCFILAVLIFFFHQIASLESKVFTIPLHIEQDGLLIVNQENERVKNVRVTVRAKHEQIADVSEKELKAFVDVSRITEGGIYKLPVTIECNESIMLLDPLEIKVFPNTITVNLEERGVKFVDVVANVVGEPAYGYKKTDVFVEPFSTKIEGPKSIVEKIDSINLNSVNIKNSSKNVERYVSAINPSSLITTDTSAKFKVTVNISTLEKLKDISSVPVVLENLDENLKCITDLPKINITLQGELLDIEKATLSSVKIFADCSEIKEEGEYELLLHVECSKGFSVAAMNLKSINIQIKKNDVIEDEEESKIQKEDSKSSSVVAPELFLS